MKSYPEGLTLLTMAAAVGRFYAIFIGKMMTTSVEFEESGAMPNGI